MGGGCRKFESFVGNLGGFAPLISATEYMANEKFLLFEKTFWKSKE
jgi:hypothetical protein